MRHLLENWPEAKELFINPIFFMSDYDGTLTPIVDRPEDADLPHSMRELLAQLVNFCPAGIISGRALEDLKSRVAIDGIYYSGNHGYRISGPDVDFVPREAERARKAIKEVCGAIERKSRSIDGVVVEDKDYTASIHYRLADESDVAKLKRILESEVESFRRNGILELNYGKEVFEIKPGGKWDKGRAVSLLQQIAGFEEESLLVYLGDDVTDEDAFSAVEGRGIGILVSEESRETAANFRLRGVSEVEVFLRKLLDLVTEV